MKDKIQLFEDRKIRSVWDDEKEEWYFSVIDVVAILTQSVDPKRYWSVLKSRISKESGQPTTICSRLKMEATDGKKRLTDVADTKQLFRIIQSVPSPKAEPFKQWLASVGAERINETIDPEIAIQRAKETYLKKGYDEAWVNQRVLGIKTRNELTAEWKKRGLKEGKDYATLTSIIHKETFDVSIKQHKNVKGLRKENLRDNMTTLEMVLSMLGEATTAELERSKDPDSMKEHINVAKAGGTVAKNARLEIEKRTGQSVVSSQNARDLLEGNKMKSAITLSAKEILGQSKDE